MQNQLYEWFGEISVDKCIYIVRRSWGITLLRGEIVL